MRKGKKTLVMDRNMGQEWDDDMTEKAPYFSSCSTPFKAGWNGKSTINTELQLLKRRWIWGIWD